MDDSQYAQSDLRFLVPLRRGQRAIVVGEAPALVEGLEEDGIAVASMDRSGAGREAEGEVDHGFVLEPPGEEAARWIGAAVTAIKPGGWLLVGFRNSEGIHRYTGRRLAEEKKSPARSRCARSGAL